ncbi:MAG: hypothetical protein ACPL3C_06945 [Pyrobaculum sp.]
MPIEEFLLPSEEIYIRGVTVQYGNNIYEVFITNLRLLLYARRGLILKKDDLVSIKLSDIQNIQYREEGLINKKGILIVDLIDRRISLIGSPQGMKTLYQNLMAHWGH